MEKKRMKISGICLLWTALCVMFGLPGAARAATFANLHFIGFSADGKYLAFENYGIGDGSGYPFSSIYLIDTVKNSVVGKPFKVMIEDELGLEATARKRVAALARRKMRELRIVTGNTGELLAARLMTDRAFNDSLLRGDGNEQKVRFNGVKYLYTYDQYYELTLKSVPVKPAACRDEGLDYHKLELILDHYEGGKKTWMPTLTLQKDETLPASRGCPVGYDIETVYAYKGKLAVFLRVWTPGYEGPDVNYMAVTGHFEFQ
jgi:predicted secreted protein